MKAQQIVKGVTVLALVFVATGAQADFIGIGNPSATTALDSKPISGTFRGYTLEATGSKLTDFEAAIHAVNLSPRKDLTSLDGVTVRLAITDGFGKALDYLDFKSPSVKAIDGTTMLLKLSPVDLAFSHLPDLTGREIGVFLSLTGPGNTAMWINQSDVASKFSSRLADNQIVESNMALAMNIKFSSVPEPDLAPVGLALIGAGYAFRRYKCAS